jgi:hypothetical protein
MTPTALGFRVKSGFAVAIALRGPASAPALIARRVVAMSDPAIAETRQPYHHGLFTFETDTRAIAERVTIVERCARRSVEALLADEAIAGCRGAALVVGSLIDPGTVANPHIRAHASEGQLFRSALQSALQAHGVHCDVIVEGQLRARAAAGLERREQDIARAVTRLGHGVDGPWRAEEKAASTAAWLLLA